MIILANERKTVVTYQGNGSQTAYAFPMDYLKKSFIKVLIDGVSKTYGVDFTVNSKQVDFMVAPSSGVIIVIYRETPTDRLVAWEDASILRANDMTLFETQLLHLAEETSDKVQDSGLAKDDLDGIWDARYVRIKNVQDPVDNLDVINKKYFGSVQAGYIQASQALVTEAANQKNVAIVKAGEAAASATAASTSQSVAKNSEANAKISETNSASSALEAAASAADAARSATAASASATVAATEANHSKLEADRADALLAGKTVYVPTFPVGAPFPWFSSTRPDGTLLCNGSSFSLSAYPQLALVYPTGILPDLRGVVPRGLDRGRGLDVDGASRILASYQEDAYKKHTHSIHNHIADSLNGGPYVMQSAHMYSQTDWSTGEAGGSETRMKNIACDWLVYATTLTYDLTINNGNAVTLGGHPTTYFTPQSVFDSTPHVISSWREGPNWYKRWSDGTIEQGGMASVIASSITGTPFTFHFPFTVSSSITVLISSAYAGRAVTAEANSNVAVVDGASFKIYSGNGTSCAFYWEAKGI